MKLKTPQTAVEEFFCSCIRLAHLLALCFNVDQTWILIKAQSLNRFQEWRIETMAESGQLQETMYPNSFGHAFFKAFAEVAFSSDLKEWLASTNLHAFIDHYPPDNDERGFSREVPSILYAPWTSKYGDRGSQIGYQRIGTGLQAILSKANPIFTEAAAKMMPGVESLSQNLEIGLDAYVRYLNTLEPDLATWSANDNVYVVTMKHSLNCYGGPSTRAKGSMVCGMLRGLMETFSGGKQFRVNETQCCLTGAPSCKFEVEKNPI